MYGSILHRFKYGVGYRNCGLDRLLQIEDWNQNFQHLAMPLVHTFINGVPLLGVRRTPKLPDYKFVAP